MSFYIERITNCKKCGNYWLLGVYNPTLCCPDCGWDPLGRSNLKDESNNK